MINKKKGIIKKYHFLYRIKIVMVQWRALRVVSHRNYNHKAPTSIRKSGQYQLRLRVGSASGAYFVSGAGGCMLSTLATRYCTT